MLDIKVDLEGCASVVDTSMKTSSSKHCTLFVMMGPLEAVATVAAANMPTTKLRKDTMVVYGDGRKCGGGCENEKRLKNPQAYIGMR